ncbi:hypothetical protein NBH08_27980 [Faecalicatena sp. BF-R-105]|nr:hypothetical protein [Faecalicatena sp. BF-R-105]
MGKGNVCVTGQYEGLYYIDNDHIHVYRKDDPFAEEQEVRLLGELDYAELTGGEWLYDEEETGNEKDDVLECFMDDFIRSFPSFTRCGSNVWIKTGAYGRYERRALLESKLFYIVVEDNEWSLALELIQKEESWGESWMENFQKRFYQRYLDGMKTCLLDRLPSIGTYGGAWTHGVIKREELNA